MKVGAYQAHGLPRAGALGSMTNPPGESGTSKSKRGCPYCSERVVWIMPRDYAASETLCHGRFRWRRTARINGNRRAVPRALGTSEAWRKVAPIDLLCH